jgi:6-phosphogluconate dehydrogenase
MVHNGIEYGIMQLIAESYDLLKNIGAYTNEELAQTFKEWETTENLQSFLIEITAEIFKQKDTETEKNLIDLIKDAAKQKGTGKWTSEAAFEYGVATPTINAAVDARIISGSTVSRNTGKNFPTTLDSSIQIPEQEKLKEIVKNALILSTIVTYYQGFELMHTASHEHEWYLNLSEIARIWRGGCIIRSDFLEKLQKAMRMNKENQMDTQLAKMEILNTFSGEEQSDWRKTVVLGATQGIPLPSINASLSYFDSLRREKLPQNLTQAQRDFFGAHTYERIDKDGTFHTEWQ